jgi:hypothetical protein
MSDAEAYPAPVLDVATPSPSDWERERQAFERLLPDLLESDPGEFVAVYGGKVVDRDPQLISLASRVYAKYGYRPIYMDLVAERPLTPVRVPHYRPLVER